MDYRILNSKNNAEGQLFASIDASTLTFLLNSGEGDKFPTGYKNTATSVGTGTTLNCTGIQASLSAIGITEAGFFIRNVTDGSSAVVTAINTNSLTTTVLKGGTDDTWQNSDEFAIGSFVLTLNMRDSSGEITNFENVLIKYASNSADTLYAESRGYAGTSAQPFAKDDFASLFVEESILKGLTDISSILIQDTNDLLNNNLSIGGIKTFSLHPKIATYSAPTADEQYAPKKYVDDNSGVETTKTFTLGETITAKKACYVAKGLIDAKTTTLGTSDAGTDTTFGRNGYNPYGVRQLFTANGDEVTSVDAWVGVQTGTRTIRCEIVESDGSTVLGTTTSAFSGGYSSGTLKNFAFSTPVSVTKGNNYYVRFKPHTTINDWLSIADASAGTDGDELNSSDGVYASGKSYYLKVYENELDMDGTPSKVYQSDSSDSWRNQFDGILKAGGSTDDNRDLQIGGVSSGHSGLAGQMKTLFVNSSGDFDTTDSGLKAGKSVSATELLIVPQI